VHDVTGQPRGPRSSTHTLPAQLHWWRGRRVRACRISPCCPDAQLIGVYTACGGAGSACAVHGAVLSVRRSLPISSPRQRRQSGGRARAATGRAADPACLGSRRAFETGYLVGSVIAVLRRSSDGRRSKFEGAQLESQPCSVRSLCTRHTGALGLGRGPVMTDVSLFSGHGSPASRLVQFDSGRGYSRSS
jgi:hypothetical protein